jgi:hypothetical protein
VGKRPNSTRDFNVNLRRIVKLYFCTADVPSLYPEPSVSRRFRVPRQVFDRVFAKLSLLPDFVWKPDALGNMGIHPLQRIAGALRVLGYGYAYDAVDELIGIAVYDGYDAAKFRQGCCGRV